MDQQTQAEVAGLIDEANGLAKVNDFESAKGKLEKAISLIEPDTQGRKQLLTRIHIRTASYYARLGQNAEAMEHAEKAGKIAEVDPKDPTPILMLVQVLTRAGGMSPSEAQKWADEKGFF